MFLGQSEVPVISIDISYHRVRVYKCTLRLLGYPQHIQLLYNASDRVIDYPADAFFPDYNIFPIFCKKLSPLTAKNV